MVTIGKQKFTLRGLTRKEIKQLRGDGFPLEEIGSITDYEKRDEGLDRIFALSVTSGDPDELTQGEALMLWAKVVAATYGGPEDSKNSGSPPPSTSGGSGTTAKRAGRRGSGSSGTARKSPGTTG